MAWKKTIITRENGEKVEAIAPEIISASRSTDIPTFYADWFFDRLKKGYCAWINPFNNKKLFVSFENTKFIVFWSKNPKPLLKYLPLLKEKKIGCYIQYSLNDYVDEGLEKGVPSVEVRIETFKKLVEVLGKGAVVWRFDPLILTDKITIDDLIKKIERIGDALKDHAEKLVISFADIEEYRKVKANLINSGIAYKLWTPDSMVEFAKKLSDLKNKKGWNFQLASCAEKIDLIQYGIEHNHCIDENLIVRIKEDDHSLMNFLGVKKEIKPPEDLQLDLFSAPTRVVPIQSKVTFLKRIKDSGQREGCGCIISKDIGQYNTCPHQCEYCYANASKELALKNYKKHCKEPFAETILGQ
ncbi:DUF1848 domain-containing protein [uncultured Turicimonas sp.]|uniref:DUF1848 domain-containing protein n=1 Tax=uncultured Turicimonas sp. TaxID=1918607 RepID=UPI003211C11D